MYLEDMVNFLMKSNIFLLLFFFISCKSTFNLQIYSEKNFYPNSESIFNAKLNDSISIKIGDNKLRLKNDSYIYFYENGNLLSAFLDNNQKVKIGCFEIIAEALGDKTRDFCDISFYENGNIHKIWSVKKIKIIQKDIQFYISSFNEEKTLSPIQFSEEGFFQEGYLADNFEYQGNVFSEYSYISFSGENPSKIILSEDTFINGKNYLRGEVFIFNEK